MHVKPYNPHRAPDTTRPALHWSVAAACVDLGDVMYPETRNTEGLREAREVCAACVVRRECLDEALADEGGRTKDSRHGIRAGLTGSQRAALYHRRRMARGQAAAA